MMNTKNFFVFYLYKSIITTPAFKVNNAIITYFTVINLM